MSEYDEPTIIEMMGYCPVEDGEELERALHWFDHRPGQLLTGSDQFTWPIDYGRLAANLDRGKIIDLMVAKYLSGNARHRGPMMILERVNVVQKFVQNPAWVAGQGQAYATASIPSPIKNPLFVCGEEWLERVAYWRRELDI